MKHTTLLSRLRSLFAVRNRSGAEPRALAPVIDFQTMLESSLDMICHVRIAHGRFEFLYTSPATAEIFGWSCEELLALQPASLFSGVSLALIAEDIAAIMAGRSTNTIVIEAMHKDGHAIWLENKVRVLERRGDEAFVMVAMRDVTATKLMQDRMTEMTVIDGLTNIHNRRAFDHTFKEEWRRAMRTGAPLSILLLDVDHFKLLNDACGHQAGDDCLRAVAAGIVKAVQRAGDFVARYGGEEFIVMLPNTDAIAAEFVASEVLHAIRRLELPHPGKATGEPIVTISCGVATALGRPGGSISIPEGLLLAADNALYKAKHLGRNRVESSFLLTSSESLELSMQ